MRRKTAEDPVRLAKAENQQYRKTASQFFRNGAPRRTRTADPLITNQVLYQLSYKGKLGLTTINICLFQTKFFCFFKVRRLYQPVRQFPYAFCSLPTQNFQHGYISIIHTTENSFHTCTGNVLLGKYRILIFLELTPLYDIGIMFVQGSGKNMAARSIRNKIKIIRMRWMGGRL